MSTDAAQGLGNMGPQLEALECRAHDGTAEKRGPQCTEGAAATLEPQYPKTHEEDAKKECGLPRRPTSNPHPKRGPNTRDGPKTEMHPTCTNPAQGLGDLGPHVTHRPQYPSSAECRRRRGRALARTTKQSGAAATHTQKTVTLELTRSTRSTDSARWPQCRERRTATSPRTTTLTRSH
jgi:hypothetical protein